MWLLLINPKSGNGRGKKVGKLVKQELKALGIEFIDISADSAQDSQENLKRKLRENQKFEGLFLIGGDGTVNLAVQELVGSDLGLALIPAGTGNDFARTLNLKLKNPEQLIKHYLSSQHQLMKVGLRGNA